MSSEAAAVKVEPAILQVEEAVAQEHGRKRRLTGAAASVTAVGKAFPLIEDAEEEVASTDGGADKRGGVGKCWGRLPGREPGLLVVQTAAGCLPLQCRGGVPGCR